MSTTPPNAPPPSALFTKPPACNQYTPLKALLTNVRFTSWKRRLPVRFRLLAHAPAVPYVGSCQTRDDGPAVEHTKLLSTHGRCACAVARMRRTLPDSVTTGAPSLGVTGVRRVPLGPNRASAGRRETGVRKHGRRFLSKIMISLSAIVPFGTGGRSNE
jgi:hypothetical protein